MSDMPDVIKYLCGESSLDGHWFGDGTYPDNGETYKRKYWWRSILRKEIESLRAQLAAAEARALPELPEGWQILNLGMGPDKYFYVHLSNWIDKTYSERGKTLKEAFDSAVEKAKSHKVNNDD